MTEGRITIDDAGHQIYYRKFGDARNTLLGLHGGPGGDHRLLAELECIVDHDLQVVVYDQLGSGRSDRPDDPNLYVVDRFVEEVEAVRAQLGLGRIHLLGRSWGGMLALQYSLDHPQEVASLIVSNSAPSTALLCEQMMRLCSGLPRDRLRLLLRHEADRSFGAPQFQDVMLDLHAMYLRRSFPFDLERSRAEFVEQFAPLLQPGQTLEDMGLCHEVMWGRHPFRCLGNLVGWDVVDLLSEISVPTLLLCGYYDEVGIKANRIMADTIPDNEFVIFGNSSHLIPREKEAPLYYAAIKNFLTRQVSRKDDMTVASPP